MTRIIIADDNADIRAEYALEVNNASGLEVDQAGNGKQLVQRVREGDYALIFTDKDMPVMDGMEAIREIRTFEPNTPIYMISGGLAFITKPKAIEAGATDYIDKSSADILDQLRAVVEKHLGGN